MLSSVPHPIPYQGSKRRLAGAILAHIQPNMHTRLVEPFAGSAAITLAAAHRGLFSSFVIADQLEPLAVLWQTIVRDAPSVAAEYEKLWFREQDRTIAEYYSIRSEFNSERDPAKLLYLLARCVKNAVRFNPSGDFNQSPDKRRKGTDPKRMRAELLNAQRMLKGRASVRSGDFLETFESAETGDFFYLDPPYEGTSTGRDSRYISGVSRDRLIDGLEMLLDRGVPYILSYDGAHGEKTYGAPLPSHLGTRVLLDVGRSSQATLNGREHTTVEALYLSPGLAPVVPANTVLSLRQVSDQRVLSFA